MPSFQAKRTTLTATAANAWVTFGATTFCIYIHIQRTASKVTSTNISHIHDAYVEQLIYTIALTTNGMRICSRIIKLPHKPPTWVRGKEGTEFVLFVPYARSAFGRCNRRTGARLQWVTNWRGMGVMAAKQTITLTSVVHYAFANASSCDEWCDARGSTNRTCTSLIHCGKWTMFFLPYGVRTCLAFGHTRVLCTILEYIYYSNVHHRRAWAVDVGTHSSFPVD